MAKRQRVEKLGGVEYSGYQAKPKTEGQERYLASLEDTDIRYLAVSGPSGSGKSFLASYYAVKSLIEEKYQKIYLTRPPVASADMRLGFVPGDVSEKMYVWLLPLIDHIDKFAMNADELLNADKIEFVSLEYIRGRSLENCIVIATEIQNMPFDILKCLLTRIDFRSKLILDGDFNQNDKFKGTTDYEKVCKALNGMERFRWVQLGKDDIIRNKDIAEILERLEKVE